MYTSFEKNNIDNTIERKKVIYDHISNMGAHFSPLFDKDENKLKNYKLLRRDKDNSPITVVTNRYKIFQHKDALDWIFNNLDKTAVNYNINTFSTNEENRYNRFHMTLTFPEISFNVDGSDTRASLDVYNSTDGTMSYITRFGAFRLVCSNGMIIGKKLFFEKSRHMIKMDPVDIYEKFEILSEEIDDFKVMLEKSQTVRINEEFTKALLAGGFPNRLIDNLPLVYEQYQSSYNESNNNINSIWTAYSVLTNWISNMVEIKSVQRAYNMNMELTKIMNKHIK